jgi:hypothetical protein
MQLQTESLCPICLILSTEKDRETQVCKGCQEIINSGGQIFIEVTDDSTEEDITRTGTIAKFKKIILKKSDPVVLIHERLLKRLLKHHYPKE